MELARGKRQDTGVGVGRRTRPFFKVSFDLIGLLRAIHVEQLIVDADIGFKDPADTGQVYGALTPLIWAIPPTSRFSVNVRPDFDQSTFSGRLDTTLSFVPVAFVPPIARFGWHAFGPWRR